MKEKSAFTLIEMLVAICILCGTSFSLLAQDGFTDDAVIKTFLHDNFDGKNAGMVIGLVDEHGARVFGAGKLDNGADGEVNGDTVFDIASVTKVFTTLLLYEMVERGEMKLDDPVSKYLPDTVKLPKYNGHEITLSHLATHTAGLPYVPDDLPHDNRVNQAFAEYTTERLYALLSRCVLTNDPGTWVDYSNIGMGLLGHVIALKAGTNYESVVVHDICRPLGMDSTGIRLSTDLKGRLAAGHSPAGKIIPNYGTGVLAGSGGLYSTVRDLLKLVSANIGLTASSLSSAMKKTQSIQHRQIEARFAPEQLYAADWMDEGQCDQTGRELLGHSGGDEGYNSFIGFDKSRRRAVVVLSNQAATMQNGIRAAAVGWFLLEDVRLTPQLALLFSPADRRGSLGIGLGFDHATHTLRVAVVVPDSSAAKAGVSAGFIVNRIDGIPTVNKSIVECGSLLAGNVGTTVRLDLIDPQSNRTNAVELTRQRFTPPK